MVACFESIIRVGGALVFTLVVVASGDARAGSLWSDLRGAAPSDQAAILKLLDGDASDDVKKAHATQLLDLVKSPSSEVRRLALRMAYVVDDVKLLKKARPALKVALADPREAGGFAAILWARSQPPAKEAVYGLLERGTRAVLARDDFVERGVVEGLAALDPDGAHPLFNVILREPSLRGLFHKFIAEAAAIQKDRAIALVPALKVAAANGGTFATNIERAITIIAPPPPESRREKCLNADNLRFRALDRCIALVDSAPISSATSAFLWNYAKRDKYMKTPLWTALAKHSSPSLQREVVGHLKARLHGNDDAWRENVARALLLFGDLGMAVLLEDIGSKNEERIIAALVALSDVELTQAQWKPICWRMIRHPSSSVRTWAAKAMKRPGKAQLHLRAALATETDASVRLALWSAVAGSPDEVDLIVARLLALQPVPVSSSSAGTKSRSRQTRELSYLAYRAAKLGPEPAANNKTHFNNARLARAMGPLVATDPQFAKALTKLGPTGWATLHKELLAKDVARRRAVLRGVRWIKGVPESWGPALAASSHDVDKSVRAAAFQVMAALPPGVDVDWHLQLGLSDADGDVRTAAYTTFLQRGAPNDAVLLALHASKSRFSPIADSNVASLINKTSAKQLRRIVDDIDARVAASPTSNWLVALHKASPKRARLRVEKTLKKSKDERMLSTACQLVQSEGWTSDAIRAGLTRLLHHRRRRLAHDAARALMRVGNRKERQRAAPIAAKELSPFIRLEMP